ncbi:MAG TPA: hypothetical protein VJ748_00640, partial [Vitreimonas sp.]|nr:hypothetical protein [Vitreimonas sp.]
GGGACQGSDEHKRPRLSFNERRYASPQYDSYAFAFFIDALRNITVDKIQWLIVRIRLDVAAIEDHTPRPSRAMVRARVRKTMKSTRPFNRRPMIALEPWARAGVDARALSRGGGMG